MPINIKDSIESSTIKGSLNGNASTATKATQDSAGQQINKTYIKELSVSGKTITYTKGDGTTGTITTQDTNTTYSTGTASALGLTKLYTGTGTATDGTMTQNAINTALNGKANSSHGRHIPDACTTITDWNSATTNGWYMGVNATNAPTSGSNIWYFGEVVAHNTNYVIQTVYHFTASTDAKAIPKYIRAKTNGTWGAWTNVTVAKAVPSNAVFTDTNTWRGVQDNLTSTATDQSLSANQGKVLKGLVDGKANSSHTHNNIVSRGSVTAESGTTRPAVDGISMSQVYNNNYPTPYGNVLNLKGTGDGQILVGWSGTSGAHAPVYVRSKRDNAEANWSGWAQIYTTANKPTPSDIGAAASSHTHSYLPLSGGTLTGIITFANQLGGGDMSSLINCKALSSGTGNGQMLTASDNQIYLGNPKTPLVVESSKHPIVNIGGSNYTMYHSGNFNPNDKADKSNFCAQWNWDDFNWRINNHNGLSSMTVVQGGNANGLYEWGAGLTFGGTNSSAQFYSPHVGNEMYWRSKWSNDSVRGWHRIWHSGNMAAPHWGTGAPSNSDGRADGTVYYRYA